MLFALSRTLNPIAFEVRRHFDIFPWRFRRTNLAAVVGTVSLRCATIVDLKKRFDFEAASASTGRTMRVFFVLTIRPFTNYQEQQQSCDQNAFRCPKNSRVVHDTTISLLALGAEVAAAAGDHDSLDRRFADDAGLALTAVHAMLELEESFFAVGVDVIGDGGPA